jgi:hypothetical protein
VAAASIAPMISDEHRTVRGAELRWFATDDASYRERMRSSWDWAKRAIHRRVALPPVRLATSTSRA